MNRWRAHGSHTGLPWDTLTSRESRPVMKKTKLKYFVQVMIWISIATILQENLSITTNKLQSTSPKGCLGFNPRWSLNCFTAWTRYQLLDLFKHLKLSVITAESMKDLQCGWFSFSWREQHLQLLQLTSLWNPDYVMVVSKKGRSHLTSRLWITFWRFMQRTVKGQKQIQKWHHFAQWTKHVAITKRRCAMDEEIALPKSVRGKCTKGSICGMLPVVDKAHSVLHFGAVLSMLHCRNWYMKPRFWKSYRRHLEELIHQTVIGLPQW